jgi:peptide-methionine (S)-S-oxide reductase
MMLAIYSYLFLPLILLVTSCQQNSTDQKLTEPALSKTITTDTTGLAKATFASGCFWCTEAYFERLKGVEAVISGYSGGTTANPSYSEVSAGRTDYAEAVQVYFNPDSVTYETLVEVFFATHDPTTLNRQGPDYGKQYRSVAFYRSPDEKKLIEKQIKKLTDAGKYQNQIVTEVQPFKKFWIAEDYHQDFYQINPTNPYIINVAKPKVLKFEASYQAKLKPEFRK